MNTKIFKFLAIACFALITITARAQDSTKVNQPTEIRSITKVNLNVIGLTLEREQKIAKTTSIYFGGGALGSFIYTLDWEYNPTTNQFKLQDNTDFKLFPILYTGLKHYYNIERRIKKGKKTINNSANYIGLEALVILPRIIDKDFEIASQLNISPQWGFQRSLGKKINFEFAVGPALIFTPGRTDFGGQGKIAFGFLL